ncbi:MAG: helix-turn-helix transcriptional regulator [Lentisphaeria bacterium]|nr:helix-turn-helix transcriptional regulator [Lentisphaeria bacterium]
MLYTWTLQAVRAEFPVFGNYPLFITEDNDQKVVLHRHSFIEILYVFRGCAEHCRKLPDGRIVEERLKLGDILGIPVEDSHMFRNGTDFSLCNIMFDPSILGDSWKQMLELPGLASLFGEARLTLSISPNECSRLTRMLAELCKELLHRQPGYEEAASALLIGILVWLGRYPLQCKAELGYGAQVECAIAFMEKNLLRPLTLEEIAATANTTKTHFCHLFRNATGMTAWEYLNMLRIEKAKFHFRISANVSIGEIADRCGFANAGYFIKMFRKREGVTPGEYLRKYRHKLTEQEKS